VEIGAIMKIAALLTGGMLLSYAALEVVKDPSAEPARGMPARVRQPKPESQQNVESTEESTESLTVRQCISLLEKGRSWLQTMPDYTATFHRQELVQGELREATTTELKLRHDPFSVTMRSPDGQTAVYCDGANDNRLAVKLGGWKKRLGWMNLDPHSSIAMQESRYPITDLGLLRLTEQLIERYRPYADATEGVECAWLPDEMIGERPCRVFTVSSASPEDNPEYRSSTVWLDQEWSIPLAVTNTGWETNATNREGLLEHYVYEDVRFNRRLSSRDFAADSSAGTTVAELVE